MITPARITSYGSSTCLQFITASTFSSPIIFHVHVMLLLLLLRSLLLRLTDCIRSVNFQELCHSVLLLHSFLKRNDCQLTATWTFRRAENKFSDHLSSTNSHEPQHQTHCLCNHLSVLTVRLSASSIVRRAQDLEAHEMPGSVSEPQLQTQRTQKQTGTIRRVTMTNEMSRRVNRGRRNTRC